MTTRDLNRHQIREKSRRHQNNQHWRAINEQRLTDEVIDRLVDMDHPTLKGYEHSMYEYVLKLNSTGQTYKVKQILDALSP